MAATVPLATLSAAVNTRRRTFLPPLLHNGETGQLHWHAPRSSSLSLILIRLLHKSAWDSRGTPYLYPVMVNPEGSSARPVLRLLRRQCQGWLVGFLFEEMKALSYEWPLKTHFLPFTPKDRTC